MLYVFKMFHFQQNHNARTIQQQSQISVDL